MRKRVFRMLKSDCAEANYFSTLIFIFVAVIVLAFIINVFGVISAKRQMDHCADQLVKQIQLSGGTNTDTTALFTFLSNGMNGVDSLTYTVNATFKTPTPFGMTNAIQLGVPFYVTVQGRSSIGGFWKLSLFRVNIVARGAGVSERYWK